MTRDTPLPADFWKIAERVCTVAQLEALRYQAAGFSPRRIADVLDISHEAVRDRLERGGRKIRRDRGLTTPEEG